MSSKIAWTDQSWNPVTGCTKVGQGRKNCYAARMAGRFWGKRKFTDVICHEDRLEIPLKWNKPQRVFVNSMSDLFHEDVPTFFIVKVFNAMLKAVIHTYQILTKRPRRMFKILNDWSLYEGKPYPGWNPGNNIWLGVSVEDQKTADERISWLLKTPAALKFVYVHWR